MLAEVLMCERDRWNRIVRSFRDYDVYYLPDYAKAFELHGDGQPRLIYYEGGGMRAVNVVMKRDIAEDASFQGKIPKGVCFDIATPYGYGGFLTEGDVTETSLRKLEEEYSAWCRRERIISEFVRFHPLLENGLRMESLYDVQARGKTISLNLQSEEQILMDMSGDTRRKVRKSAEAGVKVYLGQCAELYRMFRPLYNATMDRNGAGRYYYFKKEFYDSILHDLRNNAILFYASYEGMMIAMSIVLMANHRMHYHLGGFDCQFQKYNPMSLVNYEIACWGLENGFRTLHIGGGRGSMEDSLYQFKSGFNRNSDNTFYTGRKIFDPVRYEELMDIRKQEAGFCPDGDFFPGYRAGAAK